MMKAAVLVFLISSCAVSEVQVDPTEARQAPCCCDGTVSMTVGALTVKVASLMDKMSEMETKLQTTEKELVELKSITAGVITGSHKVAFSVALLETGTTTIGGFDTSTPLQYKRVFSNFGSNYNPATGMFTATVKGMYFFRFTMRNSHGANSVLSLMKNSDLVVTVSHRSGRESHDMGSNAAVLPLDIGDNVYVELQARRQIYEESDYNYNTFTGFLLFTF